MNAAHAAPAPGVAATLAETAETRSNAVGSPDHASSTIATSDSPSARMLAPACTRSVGVERANGGNRHPGVHGTAPPTTPNGAARPTAAAARPPTGRHLNANSPAPTATAPLLHPYSVAPGAP